MTLQEIQTAITKLEPSEVIELAEWFEQYDADAVAGIQRRLDEMEQNAA